MRNKDRYSELPETWCGLNKPELAEEQGDLVVFGIPYDGSVSYRSGAAEAPDLLRRNTLTSTPCNESLDYFDQLKVVDGGDFRGTDREVIFNEVEDYVENLVMQGKKFTMIGGDHSVTIPVHKGISRAIGQDFGIIHIDAHLDLCDVMGEDNLSHGSTSRRALELENIRGPESMYFIGIRSVERDEFNLVKEGGFNIKTAKECYDMGIDKIADDCINKMKKFGKVYITFDIDALDPAYAAGTGTPQFGGLDHRMVLKLWERLFTELDVIGFDIVEIAPSLDPSLASMYAGRKLVTQGWSYWADEMGKLERIAEDK